MSQRVEIVVLVIINLAISVIVPAGLEYYEWISRSEGILLAVLTWILLSSSERLFYVSRIDNREQQELVLWNARAHTDNRLSNIRKYYHDILQTSYGDNDLFQN